MKISTSILLTTLLTSACIGDIVVCPDGGCSPDGGDEAHSTTDPSGDGSFDDSVDGPSDSLDLPNECTSPELDACCECTPEGPVCNSYEGTAACPQGQEYHDDCAACPTLLICPSACLG